MSGHFDRRARRIPLKLAVTAGGLLGLILQLTWGASNSADPTSLNILCTAVFAGQVTWFIAALLGGAPQDPGNRKATMIIGILAIAMALVYLLIQSARGNGAALLGCTITFACLMVSLSYLYEESTTA